MNHQDGISSPPFKGRDVHWVKQSRLNLWKNSLKLIVKSVSATHLWADMEVHNNKAHVVNKERPPQFEGLSVLHEYWAQPYKEQVEASQHKCWIVVLH